MVSLNGFKVIHNNTVMRAIALMGICMPSDMKDDKSDIIEKPKFLEVLAINADGNIISIQDEAWTFQFIPIITDNSK